MSANSAKYQSAMRDGHQLAWAMKWDAAAICYRRAVAESPSDVAAHGSLATALQRLGRWDEALAECQALLALVPDDEATLSRMAEVQDRRGNAREIAAALAQLADHYLRHGRRDRAVPVWTRLAELANNDLEAQEQLYRVVSKAGETALASKIGLAITKLRGEQANDALYGKPSAVPTAKKAPEQQDCNAPTGPELLAKGMAELAEARALQLSGQTDEALLAGVRAVASLRSADATREIEMAERLAQELAGRFGGLRLPDLLGLDEALRPSAIHRMVATTQELDEGRIFGAIDQCLAGISSIPQYLPLQQRLAEAQERQGDSRAAATRYLNIADVYAMRGDFDAASVLVEKAAGLGFVSSQIREQFISRLMETGGRHIAKAQLLTLAGEHAAAGAHGEALRALERAAQLAPQDAAVLLRLGVAREAVGDVAKAVDAYRRALATGGSAQQVEIAVRLSIAASVAESFDDAEAALAIVLAAVDEGQLRDGDWVQGYARAVTNNPRCLELRLCFGAVMSHLRRPLDAAPHLELAAGAKSKVAVAAYLLLARHSFDSDLDLAGLLVERARAELAVYGPTDSHLETDLQRVNAELLLRRGDLDGAVAAWNKVKRLKRDDKKIYAKLAELHFRRGDVAAAVAELLALGDQYGQEGRHDQALGVYLGAAQLAADDAAVKGKLAETYRELGRLDDALRTMDEMATLLAGHGQIASAAEVLREMVEQCRQTDPAHALRLRERVARLIPDSFEARRELVGAYLAGGQSGAALSEASALWQDMLAVDRFREASWALEQIVQIDAWNTEALIQLGELAEKMGERTGAMERYRRALAIDPGNAGASARLNRLAK